MSKTIRLGLLMFTPMIGGAEKYLRDLIWNLDRDQFEIILYHQGWSEFEAFIGLNELPSVVSRPLRFTEYAEAVGRVDPPGPLHKLYSLSPVKRLTPFVVSALRYLSWRKNRQLLRDVLAKDRLDVIHIVNGGYPGAASAQAAAVGARRAEIRTCIMTVAGNPRPPVFLDKAIDQHVGESVDMFILPAASLRDDLVKLHRFAKERTMAIPWGIQAPDPPARREVARLRVDFGIPPDATVVGMVANFVPYKGHATLVRAFAELRPKYPNLWLMLVGAGPELARIQELTTSKGLSPVTKFTGHLAGVLDAIRAFDICVHPSQTEGLPLVVLEAMSQAKPVVASDVGGVSEAVKDGVTGFLVDPNDVLGIARVIGLLLEDSEMSRKMGHAGRSAFMDRFTLSKMIAAHQSLYKSLPRGDRRVRNST